MPSRVYNHTLAGRVRYSLFAFTFFLWLISFFIDLFVAGGGIAYINLWIIVFSGGLMLLYAPAALLLTRKDSSSGFQQAGMEVAYTVMQGITWLVIFFWTAFDVALPLCSNTDSGFYTKKANCRATQIGLLVVYIITLLTYIGWTAWVIRAVYRVKSMSKNKAYKIPTHRLLAGHHGAHSRLNGGSRATGVDLEDGQAGLFNERR
ncbi:hypothetical protein IAU60_006186 [Kwoniella sp. DSM 27419]